MGIIGVKFAFLAAVLADRESRNKRRPRITAFDGAVLAVLVDRYNADRGYSFTGLPRDSGDRQRNTVRRRQVYPQTEIAEHHS